MENENYQKDFKPFLIWLIVFMIGMNGFPMLIKMLPAMTSAMQDSQNVAEGYRKHSILVGRIRTFRICNL